MAPLTYVATNHCPQRDRGTRSEAPRAGSSHSCPVPSARGSRDLYIGDDGLLIGSGRDGGSDGGLSSAEIAILVVGLYVAIQSIAIWCHLPHFGCWSPFKLYMYAGAGTGKHTAASRWCGSPLSRE